MAKPSAPSLPATHPLVIELSSLRQQLAQYQKASHQSGIQLQGTRLELSLATEQLDSLRREKDALSEEVEVLRSVDALQTKGVVPSSWGMFGV